MLLSKLNSRRLYGVFIITLLFVSVFVAAIIIKPALGSWWNYSWQYRKSITINHAKVAGGLSNFPVLVDVTDADLASKAQSNGNDIAFADVSGGKLDHEIEFFDAGTGHLVAWVRLSALSSSVDTVFYMYYGNPSASNQQNPAGVWDSNFKMVQHLKEASGTCYDSTANHNDGTPSGGASQNVSGKIDGAAGFDGSNDYVDVGSASSLDNLNQITISAWVKMDTYGHVYDKGWTSGKSFYVHPSGYLCFVQGFTSGSPNPYGWWRTSATLSTGTWYYVVVTYDASSSAYDPIPYINGASYAVTEGNTPIGTSLSDASFNGLVGGTITYTKGVIDDVRVSQVIRSAAWISTEYNNQLGPSTFYTIGSEEAVVVPQAPALTDEYPRDGAVDVLPNPTLSIHALDLQGDPMTIIFSNNASGSWVELGRYTSVGDGTYNQTTANMDSYSTKYYWSVSATDGTNWTNKTYTFTTMPPWWNQLWQYRKSITVDHTKVAGDLSNFPVLVDVTDADLASKAQSNGNDIAFADLAGNKMDHEIELYNSAGGHLVAWLHLPDLSSSADTVFFMYYGNPSASSQQNPAGVWDSNFRMVQHLKEASGTYYDSTANNNDGIPYGGVSQNVAGKVDGAAGFDGSNDYVDVGSASPLDDLGQITISAWIKMNALGSSIYDKGWVNGKSFYVHDGGPLCFVQGFTSGSPNPWGWWRTSASLAAGAWYYVSVTYDGTSPANDPTLYVDGSLASSYEGTIPAGTALSDAGSNGLVGGRVYYTNGILDEVHISSVMRNAAWISTEYNNQFSPGTFYSVGSEQIGAMPEAPVLTDEYPHDSAANAEPNPTLSIHAIEPQVDLMTIIFSSNASGSWVELGRYTSVGDGTYNQTTANMDSYSTKYYWSVSATDGTNWTNKTYTFITMPEPPPWWDYYWCYRKTITVDHTKVAGDLSDFIVLVDTTDADLASKAQSNGNDIAFADPNGHKLDHEIEKYESASGHLVAWVRLPALSSTSDTIFFMYYGNPSASSQQNPAGVWDSNFRMVQHLGEASGDYYDSTGNHNDGTPYGGVSQGILGKIGGAASFDGNNGTCIDVGTSSTLNNIRSVTITAWIMVNSWPSYIFDKGFINGKGFYVHDNGYLCFVHGFSNHYGWWRTNDATVTVGSWHYVSVTYDNTNIGNDPVLYIDGTAVPIYEGSTPDGTASSDAALNGFIGCNQTELGSRTLNGIADELRVSNTIRSAAWVLTEYNNQLGTGTFWVIGTEERVVFPQAPWLTDEYPSDGAAGVVLNPTLSVHATDFQGDFMTIIFSSNASGSWVELGRYIGVGNGTYAQATTNMGSFSTTYHWQVCTTDGTHWQNKTFAFTTRPENYLPTVSNPFPADGSMGLPLNPLLAVDVSDGDGDPLTVIFSANVGGTWQVLGTKTGYDGRYDQTTTGMNGYATAYQWRVSVTDGKAWTNVTFSFTTISEEDLFIQIGFYACAGMPYAGRTTDKDTLRFIWFGNEYIYPWPPHGKEFILWYSDFNKETGWVNGSLLDSSWLYNCTGSDIQVGCAHFAYFGGEYHVFFTTPPESGSAYLGYMHASNWSDFESMTACETLDPFQSVRINIDAWGSAYAFKNSYAWNFFVYDYSDQGHTLVYWVWNETSGWSTMNPLWGTSTGLHDHYPHDCAGAVLLPINRTTWYLYYKSNIGGDHFNIMKSFDAGQTWTAPQIADLPQQPSWQSHRPAFVRYGDNFYMIVNVGGSDISCYNSSDGEHWGNLQSIHVGDWYAPSGTMLDQSHILWAASDLPYLSGRTGEFHGGVYKIPEMIASPGRPTNPYPLDDAPLPEGTHSTRLQVVVHGDQTYDVAFYWANGTFIGEDKLLREGEIASVDVLGLKCGKTYQWYAIARGTTYGYWGNEPSTTSDENRSDTYTFNIELETPTLETNPTSATCREYGENLTVAVSILHSCGVKGFEFEMRYNTTLLDYVDVTWPTWGSGTIIVDEINGKLTGSTSGLEVCGNQTLMIIEFRAAYYHVWRDHPGWTNDLTGEIFFQQANLSYTEGPSRRYEKGGLNEFNVGPDEVYIFSPIRGDIDNSGDVDIVDLRAVAAYYSVKQGDSNWMEASTYDLNGDGIIDVFDLVIIATNYGYTYLH